MYFITEHEAGCEGSWCYHPSLRASDFLFGFLSTYNMKFSQAEITFLNC